MELHKIKIFPKNEDFLNEIIDYFIENSKVFKREFSIDNILNESHHLPHLIEKLSPVPIDEKYGSTFQSHYRNNEPSYISHTIHSISIDEDKYYANIELWKLAYNDLMILRPVYHKPKGSSEYKIGTFDLDYDITKDIAA
jgi:hypothetical protein